jgi:Yip1-like protein
MATTTVPGPESGTSHGPLARLFGVLFNPKPAFAEIAQRPGWIVPMVVLLLISIGLNVTLAQRVDWVEVSRQKIAKSKWASSHFDQMREDRKESAYAQAAKQSKVFRYVRGFIGWPLFLLLTSTVFLGTFKLVGGARTNFATAFAITTFAHLPVGLKELIAIPVTLFKDPSAIDPDNFLVSNLAALLGNDLTAWQLVPLAFLDVFGLWALLLVAIGFSASDPKKLPLGKSIGIVFGVSLALVLFFTMLAWVFS